MTIGIVPTTMVPVAPGAPAAKPSVVLETVIERLPVHQPVDTTTYVLLLVFVLVLCATAFGIGRLSKRNRRPIVRQPATSSAGPVLAVRPVPDPGENSPQLDHLAMACLELADSVSSPALRSDIDRALRAAGYEFVDPTGQPFDPQIHDAVESRSTPDARAHNVVAATYRPGCAGRGHLLRSPEVAVFRFDAGR